MPRNPSFAVLICDPNCTTRPLLQNHEVHLSFYGVQINFSSRPTLFFLKRPKRNSYKQHYLNHSVHISVVGGLTYKVFLYITEPLKYKSAARRPLIPVIVDFRCSGIPRRCCSIVLSTWTLWSTVLVIGSIQYFPNEDSISCFLHSPKQATYQ